MDDGIHLDHSYLQILENLLNFALNMLKEWTCAHWDVTILLFNTLDFMSLPL